MARKENPIQLAFPSILGAESVFVGSKETGTPYLLLSQSKLEQYAAYLENPNQEPAPPTPEQTAFFAAGTIFHKIAQATSTWGAVLPHDSQNLTKTYYKNLHRYIGSANPTLPIKELQSLYHLLKDDRLIIPGRIGDDLLPAKKTIYQLITDKVIQQEKTKFPFSATPLLGTDQFESVSAPYTDPKTLNQIWENGNFSSLINHRVSNLLAYHESRVYNPSKIARQSPGSYGQEVRAHLRIPHLNIIWSTRFDEIYFTKDQDGKRHININDFKLGHAKFERKNTIAREIQRLCLFMTALTAQHLPEKLPLDGKAIPLTYRGPINDSDVNITYLGFKDSPNKIDFSTYYGHDWSSEGLAHHQLDLLTNHIFHIQANRQSLVHIFPI